MGHAAPPRACLPASDILPASTTEVSRPDSIPDPRARPHPAFSVAVPPMNPFDELRKLTHLFEGEELFQSVEHIPSSTTPEPYKRLLVHEHHMTVTMEEFHHCRVDVHVLQNKSEGETYSREILLTREGTDRVVQYGLVQFNFEFVTQAVKDEIIRGQTPLGRVLIQHNVLRHIDLGAILHVQAAPRLAKVMNFEPGTWTYGRMATIFCNRRPAVDLLEISTPLS
ncbi:hypothetical protein VT03_11885 [Planctomyces sp. SH-PL14]|nr:hypothetical protein VT03_11885 [Planctomyces sp. SH-PL14]